MAEFSLGVIDINSGKARATANQTDPTASVWCSSYRVQHWDGNTGKGYVGDSTLEPSTGTGVFGFFLDPTQNWPILYESPAAVGTTTPYDLSLVYIDGTVATDKFLVTGTQS